MPVRLQFGPIPSFFCLPIAGQGTWDGDWDHDYGDYHGDHDGGDHDGGDHDNDDDHDGKQDGDHASTLWLWNTLISWRVKN